MALLWPCAAAPRLAFQDSGRAAAALAPAEAWFRAGSIDLRPWFTGLESIFALGEEHPTVVASEVFCLHGDQTAWVSGFCAVPVGLSLKRQT